MLSKKFGLRKLNKTISISILIGGCLIFGRSEESSATGFKGINSRSIGLGLRNFTRLVRRSFIRDTVSRQRRFYESKNGE